MKVFISWSGRRSQAVAEALREWLPDIVGNIDTWVSSADIGAGARWNNDVQRELSATSFGVLCLTRSNLAAPWLLFEAGALSKGIENAHVCPYLIDLEPPDIPAGPLTQFQAKKADEADTFELVRTINVALGDQADSEDRLRRRFAPLWPRMHAVLTALPPEPVPAGPGRTVDDKLDEVIGLVRGLAQGQQADTSTVSGRSWRASMARGALAAEVRARVLAHPDVHNIGVTIEEAIEILPDGPRLLVSKGDVVTKLRLGPALGAGPFTESLINAATQRVVRDICAFAAQHL